MCMVGIPIVLVSKANFDIASTNTISIDIRLDNIIGCAKFLISNYNLSYLLYITIHISMYRWSSYHIM